MVDAGFLVQELDAGVGGGILAGALASREEICRRVCGGPPKDS
jgi:hypothetical protein